MSKEVMGKIRFMSRNGLESIVDDWDNGEVIDKENVQLVLLYKVQNLLARIAGVGHR